MILLPKDDIAKQPILSQIAKKFSRGKIYEESEVNRIITSFDTEDHVLFRRELINFGYLQRDPYKGTYWLLKTELSQETLDAIGKRQKKTQKD
ncbi:DUF2087 domain-containing protein [Candidatus Woesearchaeota archaeon]|nr:DUF2087 domain-containing protein [Candidatus Woesearchaeota archaeon]